MKICLVGVKGKVVIDVALYRYLLDEARRFGWEPKLQPPPGGIWWDAYVPFRSAGLVDHEDAAALAAPLERFVAAGLHAHRVMELNEEFDPSAYEPVLADDQGARCGRAPFDDPNAARDLVFLCQRGGFRVHPFNDCSVAATNPKPLGYGISTKGQGFDLTRRQWHAVILLGQRYGWKPAGTVNPVYPDWDGNYLDADWQEVAREDAAALGRALLFAQAALRRNPNLAFEDTPPPEDDPFRLRNRAVPSGAYAEFTGDHGDYLIGAIATHCLQGAFPLFACEVAR